MIVCRGRGICQLSRFRNEYDIYWSWSSRYFLPNYTPIRVVLPIEYSSSVWMYASNFWKVDVVLPVHGIDHHKFLSQQKLRSATRSRYVCWIDIQATDISWKQLYFGVSGKPQNRWYSVLVSIFGPPFLWWYRKLPLVCPGIIHLHKVGLINGGAYLQQYWLK